MNSKTLAITADTLAHLERARTAVSAVGYAADRLGITPATLSVNVAAHSSFDTVTVTVQLTDEEAGRLVDALGIDAPRVDRTQGDPAYPVFYRDGDLDGVAVHLFGRLPQGVTA